MTINPSPHYTFDELNRLTSVTYESGQKITYTYDAAGNRTSVTVTSGAPEGRAPEPVRHRAVPAESVAARPAEPVTTAPLALACAQCGAPLSPGQRFCGQCGAAVEAPAAAVSKVQFCINCGQPLEPGSTFCIECGAPVV